MPDSYLCTYATAKYPRFFVCFQRRIEPLSSLPPGVVPYQQLVMRPNGGVRPYDAQDGECECECERNVHNDAYEEDEQQCEAGLGVVLQEREQRLLAAEQQQRFCKPGHHHDQNPERECIWQRPSPDRAEFRITQLAEQIRRRYQGAEHHAHHGDVGDRNDTRGEAHIGQMVSAVATDHKDVDKTHHNPTGAREDNRRCET